MSRTTPEKLSGGGCPRVYEVNTRVWLRELGTERTEPASRLMLQDVPEEEIQRWASLGFTHVWLMGVWRTGPLAREVALGQDGLRAYAESLPGGGTEDIGASPYAISGYEVEPALGGENGLALIRQRLHACGLGLILDFIPNHVGLDHPWIHQRPELFVRKHSDGPEQVVCGKDPNFDPWLDTAQLDYRMAQTQHAMIQELESVAKRCDGVRCDMAMLVLREVFLRTWGPLPSNSNPPPGEFWASAISAVRRSWPDFLFIAEVYWGLEEPLQQLGFDYTYNKVFYDLAVWGSPADLCKHVFSKPPQVLERSLHFLENHDEARAAMVIKPDRLESLLLLMLSLPGMSLLHEGQLEGFTSKVPVQMKRRIRARVGGIGAAHERALATAQEFGIGKGRWSLARPVGRDGSETDCIGVVWNQGGKNRSTIVLVNPSGLAVECALPRPADPSPGASGEFRTMIASQSGTGTLSRDCAGARLSAVLPPFGWTVALVQD